MMTGSGVKLYRKNAGAVSVDSRRGTLQLAGYYNNVKNMVYEGKCPLVVVELTDRATTAKVLPISAPDGRGVRKWRITIDRYPVGYYKAGEKTDSGNIAIYDYAEFGVQQSGDVAIKLYNKKGFNVFDSRKKPLEVIDFAWKLLGVDENWNWDGRPIPKLPNGRLGIVYTGIPLEGDLVQGYAPVAYYRARQSKLGTRGIGERKHRLNKRQVEALKNALLVKY